MKTRQQDGPEKRGFRGVGLQYASINVQIPNAATAAAQPRPLSTPLPAFSALVWHLHLS